MYKPLYVGIVLLGIVVACFAQVFLKKAALKSYTPWYRQYLNVLVIVGYSMLLLSTFCSVIAYKVLPLSSGPIWDSAGQIITVIFSVLFFKERVSKKKLLGLGLIVCGMLIFML